MDDVAGADGAKGGAAQGGEPDDMDTLFVTVVADGQVLTLQFECEHWVPVVGACDAMQRRRSLEVHTVRQRVIV